MNKHPTSGNQLADPPIERAGARLAQQGRDLRSRRCLQRFLAWLAVEVQVIGNCLFRTDDAIAANMGWEVRAGRLGLSRTYRDPRFDTRWGSARLG